MSSSLVRDAPSSSAQQSHPALLLLELEVDIPDQHGRPLRQAPAGMDLSQRQQALPDWDQRGGIPKPQLRIPKAAW